MAERELIQDFINNLNIQDVKYLDNYNDFYKNYFDDTKK